MTKSSENETDDKLEIEIKPILKNVPKKERNRILWVLSKNNITTVRQFLKIEDISMIDGMGPMFARTIIQALEKIGISVENQERYGIKREHTKEERQDYLKKQLESREITIPEMRELGLSENAARMLSWTQIKKLSELLSMVQYKDDFLKISRITPLYLDELLDFLEKQNITFASYQETEFNDDTPIRAIGLPEKLYNKLMRKGIDTLGKFKDFGMSSTLLYREVRFIREKEKYIKAIEKLEETGYAKPFNAGGLIERPRPSVMHYERKKNKELPEIIKNAVNEISNSMDEANIRITDGKIVDSTLKYMHKKTKRLKEAEKDERKFKRDAEEILASGERTGCADSAILFSELVRAQGIPAMQIATLDIDEGLIYEENPNHGLGSGHFYTAVYLQDKDGEKDWYVVNPDMEISDDKKVKIAKMDIRRRQIGKHYIYAYIRDIQDLTYHGINCDSIKNINKIQEYVWKDIPQEMKEKFRTDRANLRENNDKEEMEEIPL